MKKILTFLFISLFVITSGLSAQSENVTIKIVHTTDVHGSFFPYDFINDRPMGGSLSRVEGYMKNIRQENPDAHILLDGGDILQGQPTVYYYNYMDAESHHICSDIMNFMNYSTCTLGNHDIETGHAVYDRWMKECNFPVTTANIIDTKTGEPYCLPYTILERKGVRIAVLGLITPSIPAWLPENLWEGLRFDDMKATAEKWVPYILEKEKPDILVGLFHTGVEPYVLSGIYNENAAVQVATEVPGFDIVFCGHDHRNFCQKLPTATPGDSVWVVNPANAARNVSEVTLQIRKEKGIVTDQHITARLVSMKDFEPDPEFAELFAGAFDKVQAFVSSPIGNINQTISTRDAFFGPSAFVDLIHQLQLDITGADISIAAPLSMNATIHKGQIYVRDMFNLYKFENMLYTMEFTGAEIKGALEESYRIWTNQMQSDKDHLLWIKQNDRNGWSFVNPSYNFDSAAGILYTVDVRKPFGEKITIKSMANGQPFEENRTYKVAVNSYRGNGGGEIFTNGAGLSQEELKNRILTSTDKDLRYYLMQEIIKQKTLKPKSLNQWEFLPTKWTKQAAQRDRQLLFTK